MKKTPKNIPSPYKFPGTPIFRDTTALPFADGGPLNDRTNHGEILNSVYASALGNYYANGGMLKRADGSYSPRGLWDNIRANAGSGKAPTKEMLAQEKKISRNYKDGGQFQGNYSLPEDSFRQGGNNLHDSIYASSPQQYPGIYNLGGNLDDRQQMYMPLDHVTRNGGSILSMSNTPQMEGEGKDLTYPEDSYTYADGGPLYTYAGRPGAKYQKDTQGNWLINTSGEEFTPIKDPTGKRSAILNKNATIYTNPAKFKREYDPLLDIPAALSNPEQEKPKGL
jgi:hypothetical protein